MHEVRHDLDRSRDDKRAQGRLRYCLHRALNQQDVDHAAADDDDGERHVNAASSATAKIAHIAVTPKGENGVGDVKVSASIMSGGLVIQSPPICTSSATTSAPPVQ